MNNTLLFGRRRNHHSGKHRRTFTNQEAVFPKLLSFPLVRPARNHSIIGRTRYGKERPFLFLSGPTQPTVGPKARQEWKRLSSGVSVWTRSGKSLTLWSRPDTRGWSGVSGRRYINAGDYTPKVLAAETKPLLSPAAAPSFLFLIVSESQTKTHKLTHNE